MSSFDPVFIQRRSTTLGTVIALTAFALAMRLLWLVLISPSEITWDGAEYARAAENLRQGLGYVGIRGGTLLVFPPLYSLLIACLMPFTQASSSAAIVVSLLAGCALVPCIYYCAARMYGRAAALYSAAIVAALPFPVDISTVVLSDALFITLACAGVLFSVRLVTNPSWKDGVLAGTAFGLAYLTRPEGFVLACASIVAILAGLGLRAPHPRRVVGGALTVALTFSLIAVPYVGFLYAHTHRLALEGKSGVNAGIAARMATGMSYIRAADEVDARGEAIGPELDATYRYERTADARPEPLGRRMAVLAISAGKHVFDVVRVLISRPYGTVLLFVLAIVGVGSGPWTRARLRVEIVVVLYVAALFAALASVYHFRPRYADGFIVPLALWGGLGVQRVCGYVALRSNRKISPRITTLVAGALALVLFADALAVRHILREEVNDGSGITERTVGQWLASQQSSARVFAVSDQSVFYAHGLWIQAPWAATTSAVMRYIERRRANYIVVSSEQQEDRPYVTRWLEQGLRDPRATLVHIVDDRDGKPIVEVYRWSTVAAIPGQRSTTHVGLTEPRPLRSSIP